MKLQDLFAIVWSRRWLAGLLLGVTVFITSIVSVLLPKKYTAVTTVVIDVQTPDRVMGIILPGLMSPSYMATQMDIVNSERVAQRVVTILGLEKNLDLLNDWQKATKGAGNAQQWVATTLMKGLDVRPSKESHVFEIEYTHNDPHFAADAANAFAQAYIDTTIELRAEPAKKYVAWFEQQYELHKKRLEEAQKSLSDFQQLTGIVITDDRMDVENQKLTELTTQLSTAEAQGADSASLRNFSGNLDTLPEVIKNPLIIQLKTEIVRLETKLKELSGELGRNHPQFKSVQAELAEMKNRLTLEASKIADSISTQGNVNRVKVSDILEAIDKQKKKILEMRNYKDQIKLFVHAVDTAQQAFDAISQRLIQTQLESQTVQTNVSVLTLATQPFKHSKPLVLVNIILAFFMGGLLALGTCIVLEFIHPVIRSRESLETILDIPVLAEFNYKDTHLKSLQPFPSIVASASQEG